MTEIAAPGARSGKMGPELLQLSEEIERMMSVPPESGSSFTALLELPATKAIELLHLPDSDNAQASPSRVKRFQKSCFQSYRCSPALSANSALVDRVATFSATADESPDTSSVPPNSSKVKSEPTDTFSTPISSSPLVLDPAVVNKNGRSVKRKEREKKAKSSPKKCKNVAEESGEDAEKLPYVHVRARRGQATDSHSIAERARREKINARMKLLQELVPGCNRISGTALVLDEIINHVQSLQRQVEYLSMRLATVNPRVDFNFGGLLATESGSLVDSNLTSMAIPLVMPEVQVNENRQQHQQQWHFDMYHPSLLGREEQGNNFLTTENSLLSYDSSANSVSLHSNQLKMEL